MGGEGLSDSGPTLEELRKLRWGPAIGDVSPGAIVNRPDPNRMRAALKAANSADLYAVAERSAIQAESGPRTLADMGLVEVSPGIWVDPAYRNFNFD